MKKIHTFTISLTMLLAGQLLLLGQGAVIKETVAPVSEEMTKKIVTREPGTNAAAGSKNTFVVKELSIDDNIVSLNSGVILLNPYKLGKTTNNTGTQFKSIEPNGTEATFFLDLGVNYVWAWNPERRKHAVAEHSKQFEKDGWEGLWPTWKFWNTLDVQANVAFYLHGNNEPTASTIVGSGDFAGGITLGLPIMQGLFTRSRSLGTPLDYSKIYDETTSAHSFNIVGSYGATTDRDSFDVHHRYFAGLGYRAAFKAPFDTDGTDKKREVLVDFRLGGANVESTSFLDDPSAPARAIKLERGDIPEFRGRWGLGFEADVYYPLAKDTYVFFGTRIYGGHDPNPWSAFIGMTLSLERLAKLLPQ